MASIWMSWFVFMLCVSSFSSSLFFVVFSRFVLVIFVRQIFLDLNVLVFLAIFRIFVIFIFVIFIFRVFYFGQFFS